MSLRLPPLRGPWATAWAVLASPWTIWALGWWLAVAAIIGFTTEPGGHPASGLVMQLPAAMLPFAVLARALASDRLRVAGLWSAGVVVACVGAYFAGGAAGVASVGGAAPTEGYTRQLAGRAVQAHLGGQLTATPGPDGIALRLGVKDDVLATANLPLDGGEAALGQWAVWLRSLAPGDEPAAARLRLTPRAGGDPVELRIRALSAAALPDGSQVAVQRISPDFGRALGPAAQVQVDSESGSVQAWHFVDAPDLDRRIGDGPWAVELLAVETEPKVVLGVRRRGTAVGALAGLGVMALALGLGLRGRARS
ncbi:MAG: hypothetical protein H6701_08945 [Myxococcales bacterium]|nr:hypothetical protein [Myxococcales bacterium]